MHEDVTTQKGLFFMIYVGIDAASNKHDVCIMSEEGEIFGKVFQIQNSQDEYKKLLNKIKDAKKLFKDSNVRIGIESTGAYSSALVNYLSNCDAIEVIYINPILTNMFQHSELVHYAKTDKLDAEGICNFLQQKKKKLYTYTPPSYHIQEAKSLGRELNSINKSLNKQINHLTSLLHVFFLNFFKFFLRLKENYVYLYLKHFLLLEIISISVLLPFFILDIKLLKAILINLKPTPF